jgi:hypothetical protein
MADFPIITRLRASENEAAIAAEQEKKRIDLEISEKEAQIASIVETCKRLNIQLGRDPYDRLKIEIYLHKRLCTCGLCRGYETSRIVHKREKSEYDRLFGERVWLVEQEIRTDYPACVPKLHISMFPTADPKCEIRYVEDSFSHSDHYAVSFPLVAKEEVHRSGTYCGVIIRYRGSWSEIGDRAPTVDVARTVLADALLTGCEVECNNLKEKGLCCELTIYMNRAPVCDPSS